MKEIIPTLSDSLEKELKLANEIWIAVSLMNLSGLKFIQENINKNCKQNYLLGVDLPTDPEAFKKLNEMQFNSETKVRVFSDKKIFFHPKLYLLQHNDRITAYIGSANCTDGGLNKNIELSICIKDEQICRELKNWFEKYYQESVPLTTEFVENYKKDFIKRQNIKKQDEKIAKKAKESSTKSFDKIIKNKEKLIERLKKYRKNEKAYLKVVETRERNLRELRESLDYPGFNKMDIEKFFKIKELGHLIEIAKPSFKRNEDRLKKLMSLLCNENIDIAERYNKALSKEFKLEGANRAFITKILTIHRPDLYYVKNNKSERALRKYGKQLPRGISEGEKYKIMCEELKKLCRKTDIKDLSVLDHYLYIEGR
uniref:Phospholipase D-like domain-containing protein n=1 Tax=Ignavibacterium album TaxID=591197 RepID=A0A832CVL7_9BACT